MWTKNLLFLGLCLVGVLVLASNLAPTKKPPQWDHFDPGTVQQAEFRQSVDQVNATFRAAWADQSLTPAPRADDLAIARRLSLSLKGVDKPILLHGHCHQKAFGAVEPVMQVLRLIPGA